MISFAMNFQFVFMLFLTKKFIVGIDLLCRMFCALDLAMGRQTIQPFRHDEGKDKDERCRKQNFSRRIEVAPHA